MTTQNWRKMVKVFQTGRKHCGKRRNCSLRAISPFPAEFSKDLFFRQVKSKGMFWKGLQREYNLNSLQNVLQILTVLRKATSELQTVTCDTDTKDINKMASLGVKIMNNLNHPLRVSKHKPPSGFRKDKCWNRK